MAKKYVLWVVHTDMHWEATTWDKEIAHRHIDAVIRAMIEAQRAGMPIVYENRRTRFAKGFLDLAKSKGAREIIRMRFFEDDRDFMIREGRWAVKEFLKILKKKRIEDFEVLLCGHYISDCINHRAVALKERGIRPLLVGPASMRGEGMGIKEIEDFYGRGGIIPIGKIRGLQ